MVNNPKDLNINAMSQIYAGGENVYLSNTYSSYSSNIFPSLWNQMVDKLTLVGTITLVSGIGVAIISSAILIIAYYKKRAKTSPNEYTTPTKSVPKNFVPSTFKSPDKANIENSDPAKALFEIRISDNSIQAFRLFQERNPSKPSNVEISLRTIEDNTFRIGLNTIGPISLENNPFLPTNKKLAKHFRSFSF